eukprot:m51a1_g14646 putative carboxylesterase (1519) ;mRNA; r:72868-80680
MHRVLLASATAALLLQCVAADAVVNVTLPYGTVQGLATATGVSYYDIPFALPPTGEFNGGNVDGTHNRNIACTQIDAASLRVTGTEDCLTLSVFAPANATGSALLPVLFWIHGGAWTVGSATEIWTDGRPLATTTGSVVVAAHYRLGPLGFLALDELLREAGDTGNYGIHDLVEALRWVQAHIAAFGGDKDRVAVFGESAGGGNVLELMSLPSTRGLFRAAISESAPGVNLRLAHQRATSQRLASRLGCNDSAALLACLRATSAQAVITEGAGAMGSWGPTVDGALLNGTLESRLASGNFNRVPLIVGSNANDGAYFMYMQFQSPVPRSSYAQELAKLQPDYVSTSPAAVARVLELYPAVDDMDNRKALVEFETDMLFSCPARRYARAASKWVSTFGYVWWGVEPCVTPAAASGHADEIDYVWQNNVCQLNETGLGLGRAMNHYWASMAAHGNPNEGRMAWSPVWKATNGDKWQALDAAGIREIPTIRADSVCASTTDTVVNVTLPYGTVQGLATATGVSYYDIPFALPPTGQRRWRAPEPWAGQFSGGELDGTRSRNIACMQMEELVQVSPEKRTVGTEDCLTLNVFTPADSDAARNALLPVLFWIHGGAWIWGTPTDLFTDGRRLATTTGSVVVSAHYRLGVYGFLALDELLREAGDTGNYGIHDLVEALRWVQAHIAAFGGDKDRVAVFGESAGGNNAVLLTSLPSTRGLFRAAISESAPGRSFWLPRQRATSQRVATQLGCNDSATLLACLRAKGTEELMERGEWTVDTWGPTINGAFLDGTVESRLASGNFNRVPLLVGSNANDGGFFVHRQFASPVPRSSYVRSLAELRPETVSADPTSFARALELYPTAGEEDSRKALVEFETDMLFSCPARRYARAASKWVDTFGFAWWGVAPCATPAVASSHVDEIDYVWQNNVCQLNETGLALGRAMNHYWASMAAHGNPNDGRMAGAPLWNATKGDKWQALDAAGIREIPTIRADRCDFWDAVYEAENTPSKGDCLPQSESLTAASPSQCVAADAVVNVTLPYGTVQGLATATGVSFYDIPFALPPIGERRWRAPEPWEGQFSGGVLDGTHSRNIACVQVEYRATSFHMAGTEDCLTLNVFAPANATGSALLPQIVSQLGCNDSATLLACIRNKSTEDVIKNTPGFLDAWGPTIDGVFLEGTIESRLESGNFNRVPLIVGSNANDGGSFVYGQYQSPVPRSTYAQAMANLQPQTISTDPVALARALELYPAVDDADNRRALTDYETDMLFSCPARRYARAASKWADTYAYVWWGVGPCEFPAMASVHADEIDYIWQNNGACKLNETALEFGRMLNHYWASMAAHGNPNEGRMAGSPAWETSNGDKWQALDAAGIHEIPTIRADRCDFWDEVYDAANRPAFSGGVLDGTRSRNMPVCVASTRRSVRLSVRLGPLGFLALKKLLREAGDTGNYGIHVFVEALRWIQAHIAAFGGDKDRAVVFQSAPGRVFPLPRQRATSQRLASQCLRSKSTEKLVNFGQPRTPIPSLI